MFTGLGATTPFPTDAATAAAQAKSFGYSVPFQGFTGSQFSGGGYLYFANPNGSTVGMSLGVLLGTDSVASLVLGQNPAYVAPPASVIQAAAQQFLKASVSAPSTPALPAPGSLPNSGDSATAIAMAQRDGVSVPYGVQNSGGAAILMVANSNGSLSNVPIRSTSAPYVDSGLTSIGVNLSTAYAGLAIATYGLAGASPAPLPAPAAVPPAAAVVTPAVTIPAPATPANPSAPSPSNPTVPTPAASPSVAVATPASGWGFFGASEPCMAGFPIGLYTAGLGAFALGWLFFGGRGRR